MKDVSMAQHAPARRYSRRQMLGAAVALGATAIAPRIALGRQAREVPGTLGLLVPQSRIMAALGARFAAGVALALRGSGLAPAEPLVYGVSGMRAARTAAQLAEQRLPAVVGLVHPRNIAAVATALHEHGTRAVAACVGEAAVEGDRHAYVSLELAASQSAFGAWACGRHGPRAAMLGSFYDCGFAPWRAFRQGFESGGGRIVAEVVADAPAGGPGPRAAVERALAAEPDLLYLGTSGREADALLAELGRQRPRLPLLVSPFGVDIDRPSRALAAELGVLSASGRPANLAPDAVADFARRYTAVGGTADDNLALLGYAAGLAVLDREQPRFAPAPISVWRLRIDGRAPIQQTLAELPVPAGVAAAIGGARWTNPYLSR